MCLEAANTTSLWIRCPSATVLHNEAGCVQLLLNLCCPPQAMTLPIAKTHRHTDIPTFDSPLFTGQPGVAPLDYGHSQEFFLGQAARTVAGGVRTRRGDMLLKPSLYAYACARAVRVPILERKSGPWAGGPVCHGRITELRLYFVCGFMCGLYVKLICGSVRLCASAPRAIVSDSCSVGS